MLRELQAEQQDDFDKKDRCKDETDRNEHKIGELDGKIAKFKAQLDSLETGGR